LPYKEEKPSFPKTVGAMRGMSTIIEIFWPVDRNNYFLWPLFFLIPLMAGDVLTTTYAIREGYTELNPLLSNLIADSSLHFMFKLIIPVLLLFLCIFIYSSEKWCGEKFSATAKHIVGLIKLCIFLVLSFVCFVYISTVAHNIALLGG
jgi:hypothetical protein